MATPWKNPAGSLLTRETELPKTPLQHEGSGAKISQLHHQHTSHLGLLSVLRTPPHLEENPSPHSASCSWGELKVFGPRLLSKYLFFCFENPYEQLCYNLHYHCPLGFLNKYYKMCSVTSLSSPPMDPCLVVFFGVSGCSVFIAAPSEDTLPTLHIL